MRFERDIHKSERNFELRGFDFGAAAEIFTGFTVETPDNRRDYGENRVLAIGEAAATTLTVVYTDRVDEGQLVRRIISARRSNRHERKEFQKATRR